MKILIIKSKGSSRFYQGNSYIRTDGIFATERFIPNLEFIINNKLIENNEAPESDFNCKSVQKIELPSTYPILIDDPSEYLPEKFEEHDLVVALGIHEDILMELPKIIKKSGGKALIVPLESREWLTKWVREKTIEECKKYNIQYAFPKPFCSLEFGEFDVINQFINKYRLGKPKFRLQIDKKKVIVKAEVLINTPCGNLYDIEKELCGKKLGEEAREVVARYWHKFSCLGDVHIDPEVEDTIVHIGGHIHYSAIDTSDITE